MVKDLNSAPLASKHRCEYLDILTPTIPQRLENYRIKHQWLSSLTIHTWIVLKLWDDDLTDPNWNAENQSFRDFHRIVVQLYMTELYTWSMWQNCIHDQCDSFTISGFRHVKRKLISRNNEGNLNQNRKNTTSSSYHSFISLENTLQSL